MRMRRTKIIDNLLGNEANHNILAAVGVENPKGVIEETA